VLEEDGMLHLRAHNAVPAALLAPSRVIPMGKGLAGRVAEQKRALRMSDMLGDTDPRIPIEPKPDEVAAALCVPLFDGSKVVGTLGIAANTGRKFSTEDEQTLIDAGRVIAKTLAR
jgi:putative methionine-R-sulfoxide reductase with GAF domain